MTHEHRGAQRYDGHDHIQIAVSIYVEVQQSYQMESGAEVPVFAEPYNVRVLYGEIELCDKDTRPFLLGHPIDWPASPSLGLS